MVKQRISDTRPWKQIALDRKKKLQKEVVEMPRIEIPVIKFEKNPENREEVIAMGRKLEVFKNEVLKGVDMSKVEGTEEYKKIIVTINQFLNDHSMYEYLKNAQEVQLWDISNQIKVEVNNFYKLVQNI